MYRSQFAQNEGFKSQLTQIAGELERPLKKRRRFLPLVKRRVDSAKLIERFQAGDGAYRLARQRERPFAILQGSIECAATSLHDHQLAQDAGFQVAISQCL